MHTMSSHFRDCIDYTDDVLKRKIVTSKYIYKAVKRFVDMVNDIDNDKFYFDQVHAEKICNFFENFKHYKGEFAKKSFVLEPWQKWIIFDTFGFYTAPGKRLKQFVYLQVARKNGKTTFGAVLSLFNLFEERAAEVYLAANGREQSSILLRDAKNFAQASRFNGKLNVKMYEITTKKYGSFMKNISAESNRLDGLNASMIFYDEYHSARNNDLFEVLESSQGARKNPMFWVITTAGFILNGPCHELRKTACQVLDGEVEDLKSNYYLFELDENDDIADSSNYIKANPNMGISVSEEWLADQYAKTLIQADKMTNFLTKHCNIFVASNKQMVTSIDWDKCKTEFTEEDLEGQKCYAGLDLSIAGDLTAFTLLFPQVDGKFKLLNYSFTHKEKLLSTDDTINYKFHEQQGELIVNAGKTVDYDQVEYKIRSLAQKFNIVSIGYDRYHSYQIMGNLAKDDFVCNPLGMGYVSLSLPTKTMQNLVAQGKLLHNDNKLFTKQLFMCELENDPAGNIKPTKRDRKKKIDNVVSSIVAIAEYLEAESIDSDSAYESRDILFI